MAQTILAERVPSPTRGALELARSKSPVQHTNIYLPPKAQTADGFWAELDRAGKGKDLPQNVRDYYNEKSTGGQHSTNDRTVFLYMESSGETLAIGAKVSTKVQEIKELVGYLMHANPGDVTIRRKTAHGYKMQSPSEEIASNVVVGGVLHQKREKRQYQHTIVIIGAGLGGMQSMIDLKEGNGRTDLICYEKHEDFGGHSWISVANKFTKLQTEKGTYHVDYILPHAAVPQEINGEKYKTWPTRDALLRMFRENAKEHGLYEYTMFNTSVEKVKPKNGAYAVSHVPEKGEDDGGVTMAGAVVHWPGNLIVKNEIEFPGEDEFNGYIEYSSFDRMDYMLCTGKEVILYGHGAFTIENVRTLVEHRCKKVNVVCRRRNLCGMKMASWMVGLSQVPVPGTVMLDVFQVMYDLVGFDVWSAHSVQTDANRTFAQISQKTVFGVTDIYFLAGYYGLMEVHVDEIKRLTDQCAHTKKMKKIPCECIIKAIGTSPSFKVDRTFGIKELVGLWINNDPLRPISCNGMFVQARNFGSFSSGPGFVGIVKMMSWFINFPDDWLKVSAILPHNAPGERPAYVPGATYFLPMFMAINSSLPDLARETAEMDSLKARKQAEAHPLEEFLPQCEAEWKAYIKMFKEAKMVDDRPEPPYPYTLESMRAWIDKANAVGLSQAQARGRA